MTQQLMLKSKTAAWYLTQSVNYLLYSQVLDNAVWIASNMTRTSGQTDPSAGTTAYTLTATGANATLLQAVSLRNETLTRTFSLYVKRKTGTGVIQLTADGTTYETISITSSWARYDVSLGVGNLARVGIKIVTSGDEVYAAWAQFEDGAAPSTYVANTANRYTVTQIVDADYPANTVRGCAFLDGRFFVMTPAGEVQQSGLEDASSWAALEFIQSQIDPGRGVYITKINNYIVTFKDWSTEFFYDAANATGSILSPVQNAALQIGCASDGSVQEVAGTILFMGQTRLGQGRSIYALNGTTPQKLSTPAVEKILSADSLTIVYSWSAQVGSHLFYGLTLVGSQVTLVYDLSTQVWAEFSYLRVERDPVTITAISAAGVVTAASHGYADGRIVNISSTTVDFNGWHVVTDVTTNTFQIQATGTAFSGSGASQSYREIVFPAVSSVRAGGHQYLQDASTGALYELSPTIYSDEIGATAMRIRTAQLDDQTTKNKPMSSAELVGDKIDSTALIRTSDDDYQTWGIFRSVDLSAPQSKIRRLGAYRRRAFEILHVRDALVRLSGLDLD